MSFKDALAETLRFEGGYVNNIADRGGETNYGITKATARAFGYTGSMRKIPLETVEAIYRTGYWDINQLDKVDALTSRTASEVFDCGVNCGPKVAARMLQEALNLLNDDAKLYQDLVVDGSIADATLEQLAKVPTKRLDDLLLVLKALRAERYLSIVRSRTNQEVFIRGWLRRVFRG